MAFRSKQIRKNPPKKPLQFLANAFSSGSDSEKNIPNGGSKKGHIAWGSLLVLFGVFFVFKVTTAAYDFVTNFDLVDDVLRPLGEPLQEGPDGVTNFVLLGTSSAERTEGASLIDAIMGVSIDWDKKTVAMVSIPRDYWVSDNVDVPGRINSLYVLNNHLEEGERNELYQEVVGDILGLEEVHYYIKIDFNGFEQVVDGLGGIEVNVPTAIYDNAYPNETDNGYTIFQVDEGLQQMDGTTALKYARTRHDGYGDFGRAARQQILLEAIREKALSAGVLTSPGTIKDLYNAITDNMSTNLTIREMIELAAFMADDFDRNGLVRTVLHDDPGRDGGGGFLMAGSMELYGGYTLLPYNNDLELLHKYTDLIFGYPDLFANPYQVEVQNATRQTGLAYSTAYQLNRFGFNVADKVGNYEDEQGERQYLEKSLFIYYPTQEEVLSNTTHPQIESLLEVLPNFVKGMPLAKTGRITGETPILTIVLGEDHELYVP